MLCLPVLNTYVVSSSTKSDKKIGLVKKAEGPKHLYSSAG